MCVVKFFKNLPKNPSLHIKAIYRMPIELNRITLEIPKAKFRSLPFANNHIVNLVFPNIPTFSPIFEFRLKHYYVVHHALEKKIL
jgi:hypothetical protein